MSAEEEFPFGPDYFTAAQAAMDGALVGLRDQLEGLAPANLGHIAAALMGSAGEQLHEVVMTYAQALGLGADMPEGAEESFKRLLVMSCSSVRSSLQTIENELSK